MKKSNLIFATIILLSSLFISNTTNAQERKGPPPNGERKGPPKGGNHNPEQSKTLEEIGGYKIGDVATDLNLKM